MWWKSLPARAVAPDAANKFRVVVLGEWSHLLSAAMPRMDPGRLPVFADTMSIVWQTTERSGDDTWASATLPTGRHSSTVGGKADEVGFVALGHSGAPLLSRVAAGCQICCGTTTTNDTDRAPG